MNLIMGRHAWRDSLQIDNVKKKYFIDVECYFHSMIYTQDKQCRLIVGSKFNVDNKSMKFNIMILGGVMHGGMFLIYCGSNSRNTTFRKILFSDGW